MVRICWELLGYQNIAKLKNWKAPWGLNDFVTVCYALCLEIPVQSVPSSKSQTLTPQGLLAQQLRPSKGVQRLRGDVAHDLKLNNGEKCWDRFSIPRRWKPPIFRAQKRPWPICQQPLLLTRSVGCKNWSGSKSPQCGEKCWVLGPRKDRTRYGSTQSAFIYGMPLVHWSNIITSVHRPPQKPKRFRVEMAIEVLSS